MEEFGKELSDRYGPLPQPAQNLIGAVQLKVLASRLGAESLHTSGNKIILRLAPSLHFSPAQQQLDVPPQINIGTNQLQYTPNQRLPQSPWQAVLTKTLKLLAPA